MNRLIFVSLLLILAPSAFAQGSAEEYRRADALPGDWPGLVRHAEVPVRWIDAATPVYPYTHADGTQEWRTVDLETGRVRPAFDHGALGKALEGVGALPENGLRIAWFEPDGDRVLFMLAGDARIWSWVDGAGRLEAADPAGLPERFGLAPVRTDRTRSGGPATTLFVVNATPGPVRLAWLDHEARSRAYATIEPGASHRQNTYTGHAWRVIGADDEELGTYVASERPGVVFVRGPVVPPEPPVRERGSAARSPDGRFRVVFRDHQVVLRSEADGSETVLTSDGTPEDRYEGPVRWSPDSERFVVMRTMPGDERTVHIVESSPRDQLQPRLISFGYRKPGDRVDVSRPRLFVAGTGAMVEPDDGPIENPWSVGRVEWSPDGSRFFYLYNGRGHQRVRYVAVDASTGAARVVADERSETFIDWTNKVFAHRIDATDELVWMSERSGWNHLYLHDLTTGAVKHAITSGEWVVRGVDRVDEEGRAVWLRVMGVNEGEDPYHIHHARVGLDGTGFTILTEGDGTHRIDFSPDGAHFVDVWSRADLAPVTEIRRSSDGSRVAVLAEADASALVEAGWTAPERFVATGRDGETEIWGLIHRPTNFDASKRYPVIESIYAGPHGQHVPKAFSVWHGARSLAELGFVVVQIDGMGTNWRSKAFHDVAYKNLKDAGFPDRIAWMKAAAADRPWMDLDRVGIYGVSAGGQSALGALLFHGDFYKAAVADCGCHDNRMDKIWWNEQWMGWPVDDSYAASSNVEHAANLQGHLLLTVGEVDQNVDPASTMQVVDALIRADKDFELIVFPGLGHGTIGSAYGQRRMRDFFVRHLHGREPRWE
ncbi:MAG: prolyl oligopeptidase family serine peptidase [Phycisphaerales bacterium]|nr:prolyl oligopeptidase family serine peptidase [Phycisphaerales bacterium]